MTSVKQMVARMNGGHFQALTRLSQGLPMFDGADLKTPGDHRGASKISSTLFVWGAISNGKVLTGLGRELLAAAQDKFTAKKSVQAEPKRRVSAHEDPGEDYEWMF